MTPRYEPRTGFGKIPTDCCDFAVVDLEQGIEVCRVWTADNARKIARLMNDAEGRKVATISACLRQSKEPL